MKKNLIIFLLITIIFQFNNIKKILTNNNSLEIGYPRPEQITPITELDRKLGILTAHSPGSNVTMFKPAFLVFVPGLGSYRMFPKDNLKSANNVYHMDSTVLFLGPPTNMKHTGNKTKIDSEVILEYKNKLVLVTPENLGILSSFGSGNDDVVKELMANKASKTPFNVKDCTSLNDPVREKQNLQNLNDDILKEISSNQIDYQKILLKHFNLDKDIIIKNQTTSTENKETCFDIQFKDSKSYFLYYSLFKR